jgi:hypothetical protein
MSPEPRVTDRLLSSKLEEQNTEEVQPDHQNEGSYTETDPHRPPTYDRPAQNGSDARKQRSDLADPHRSYPDTDDPGPRHGAQDQCRHSKQEGCPCHRRSLRAFRGARVRARTGSAGRTTKPLLTGFGRSLLGALLTRGTPARVWESSQASPVFARMQAKRAGWYVASRPRSSPSWRNNQPEYAGRPLAWSSS